MISRRGAWRLYCRACTYRLGSGSNRDRPAFPKRSPACGTVGRTYPCFRCALPPSMNKGIRPKSSCKALRAQTPQAPRPCSLRLSRLCAPGLSHAKARRALCRAACIAPLRPHYAQPFVCSHVSEASQARSQAALQARDPALSARQRPHCIRTPHISARPQAPCQKGAYSSLCTS